MSPWAHQRETVGLYSLVRVIDLERDRQEFVALRPKNAGDLTDLVWNGETVILPLAERLNAEVDAIVRRFDERYWQDPNKNQTRWSALAHERYLNR